MSNDARIRSQTRDDFPHYSRIQTRWSDNDIYGHVNNAIYYHYIDSVVNEYLINSGALDPNTSSVIGLVAETRCTYFSPIEFPQRIDAGLRASRIGNSSVTYDIGLFVEGEQDSAATASFIHVYVDRNSRRPAPLTNALRVAAENIAMSRSV